MDKTEKIIAPQLLPIEKNTDTRIKTILTNIIKMLTERDLLSKKKLDQNIKQITSTPSDDMIYKVNMDNSEKRYGKANSLMIIKIINQKITSVSKSSGIMEFLNQYKLHPKIIIVQAISLKTQMALENDPSYPNTEIFLEKELMINLIDHISVPTHILMSEEESEGVTKDYMAKKKNLPKILVGDPVARYYNAKIGRVFRIIRSSETAGRAPYYRLVVRGQIKDA